MQQMGFNFMANTPKSQQEKVLWHLEQHGSITNMAAFELYHITQLQGVIRDLRKKFAKEGFKRRIDSIKQTGCNEDGRTIQWVKYVLTDSPQFY